MEKFTGVVLVAAGSGERFGCPKAFVTLAGCGGTGSFLALHLARLAYHARERHGLDVRLAFVDPDVVEEKNVGRQNFCPAEVGQPKAQRLMARYNRAFGLSIRAHVGRFEGDMVVEGVRTRGAFCLVVALMR